ncbi:MAG: DUF255 domain-containing protein [Gemmatimonadota bacterium]|nr:DUF255 domain-containing protein [Gemmatimonadota bacterium]
MRQNIWIALVFGVLACGGGDEATKLDVTALDGGRISWRTWSQRDSARILGRPILLFLYTQRSVWCRDLVVRCFEDSEIARAIARYTLPVWVDADQRPDLFERFGLGGVPSLVFLTPDGQWITGSTYLDPGDMTDLLRWVQILYDNPDRLVRLEVQRAELKRRVERDKKKDPRPRISPSAALLHRVRDSLKSVIKSGFDPGPEGLLALAEAGIDSPLINFAHSARRDTDGVYVLRVLTHRGPVIDAEKHMAVNAQLLRAFAQVNLSRDLADAMLEQFALSDGVLLGAGLTGFRDQAGNILRDAEIYSGWNALAVSGLCAAFLETREARFLDAARRIFEAVKTRFVQEDSLFAHARSLSTPYFLLDQVLIIRAALDLFEVQEREADLLFARAHADRVMIAFADSSGALKDRTPEAEVSNSPAIDRWLPSGNGVAAQVLMRLFVHTKMPRYQDRAETILTVLIGPNIDRIGYAGALNRALALFVRESKN